MLTAITDGGGIAYVEYEYDYNGRRSKRIEYGGYETEYFYDGDKLIAEKLPNGNYKYYFYDESGVCGMRYNNVNYEFVRNIFGDVIAIYQGNTGVAEYCYDAWGNCKITNYGLNIAAANPFRYRGYYYDVETNLYYLQTRYYDPTIGQFINPDTPDYLDPETIGGVNLYAYGLNNPVMYIDPTGHFVLSTLLVGAAVGLVVSVASSIISQAISKGGDINWAVVAVDGVFGAISGALGAVLGPTGSIISDTLSTFFNSLITTAIENEGQLEVSDWISIAASTALTFMVSSPISICKKGISDIIAFNDADDAVKNVKNGIKNGSFIKKKPSTTKKLIKKAKREANLKVLKAYVTENAFFSYGTTFVQSMFGSGFSIIFEGLF